MNIPLPQSKQLDIYSYGLNKNLYRDWDIKGNSLIGEGIELINPKLLSSGELTGDFNLAKGIITGGKIQTGTDGERIVMYNDIIAFYDSNNKFRTTSNSGYIGFWDESEVASGSISASMNDLYLLGDSDIFLSANSGSGNFYIAGDFIPLSASTYDLGISIGKWKNLYLSGAIVANSYGGISEANLVDKSATESIGGTWTYSNFPYTPSSAPTSNYQVANKKYVDDNTGVSGANTSLSNLSSVAVNTHLLPSGDGTKNLGSSGNSWNDIYLNTNSAIWFDNESIVCDGTSFVFSTHLDPELNDNYNLGGSLYKWKNLYLSGQADVGSIKTGTCVPRTANTTYCGTSVYYWKYVYSYYFKYKVSPSSFDKYDDLQILRDLKTTNDKLNMKSMPKEIYDKEGFTNMGNLQGFNLCASKKIVECVDDLKSIIEGLTNRLNKLENGKN